MVVSNAERQRRHRERLRVRLAETEQRGQVARDVTCGLSAGQQAARDLVVAGKLYPLPKNQTAPLFLGWNRFEWTHAPDEVVKLCGMMPAVRKWRGEYDKLLVGKGSMPKFDRGKLYDTAKAKQDAWFEQMGRENEQQWREEADKRNRDQLTRERRAARTG